MEQEVLELKDEIEYLTKRIEILENNEKKRKAFFYVKLLVKILMLGVFVFSVWRGYEYLSQEIPRILEEKIKEINPLKN